VADQENNGQEAEGSSIIGAISRPAAMEALPGLCEFAASIERQEGFSNERIAQIEPAFKAALENIVVRAYRSRSGEIRVECRHDYWGKLLIVISDDGEPVNILLADVALAGEEATGDEQMRATARLIKRTIDNIEYKRVERENILTFFVSGELRGKASSVG